MFALHVNMCAPAFPSARYMCLKDTAVNTAIDSAQISFTLLAHLLLASATRQVWQSKDPLQPQWQAFPQVQLRGVLRC